MKYDLSTLYPSPRYNLYYMATKTEPVQKREWWINELESLGVSPNKTNELNDKKEISNLAEIIKQILYLEYKNAYDEN